MLFASRTEVVWMLSRRAIAAALVLALPLLATAASGGSLFCNAAQAAETECCCHDAEQANQLGGCPGCGMLQSIHDCCTQRSATDATTQCILSESSAKRFGDAVVLANTAPTTTRVLPKLYRVPDVARAPPPDSGPPLFIQNCTYLI